MTNLGHVMTIIPAGQNPSQPPPPAAAPGPVAPAAAPEPKDRVTFVVDPQAPHTRLVIPHEGRPLEAHPVSGSRSARFAVAGSIVGAMSGGYIALGLLSAFPLAAASVALGSAVVGGIAGYVASR